MWLNSLVLVGCNIKHTHTIILMKLKAQHITSSILSIKLKYLLKMVTACQPIDQRQTYYISSYSIKGNMGGIM